MEKLQPPGPEREVPTQDWWFTFGSGQQFDGHYVVMNGTYDGARDLMFAHFGNRWSMQYPTAEAAGVEQFRMRRLDAADWPPVQLTHYNPDSLDVLLTACGISLEELRFGEAVTNPAAVTCPTCVEHLGDVQLSDAELAETREADALDSADEYVVPGAPVLGPEPAAPERRTVGLEVITDEHGVFGEARVAIALRVGGRLVAAPEDDAFWRAQHVGSPVDVLSRLLTSAMHLARPLDDEPGAELLMPGADVLAALAGQPDLQAWTAPVKVRADQVQAGWRICNLATEGVDELVTGVVECEDKTCPWNDCYVVLTKATEPIHFADWQDMTVRIPAAVTR